MHSQQHDPQSLRDFATDVAARLRGAGFEALFAGGCVRDQLLGRAPKDYDVATSAKPEEVEATFSDAGTYTVPVGAAFGVICIVDPKTKMQVEVATFRSDGAYLDGRRPVNVTFSNPQEDAYRRDFTINGLFFNPETEQIIDYVEGRKDLKNGVVRAIGDPAARFTEDKLRLLRAVRFTATLGFILDEQTESAIRQMPEALRLVSAERVTGELERMLLDPSRAAGLQMLHTLNLLAMLFPEAMQLPDPAQFTELLEEEAQLADPSFPLALAPLLARVTDADGTKDLAQQWRLSTRQATRTAWLVKHRHALHDAAHQSWPRLQRILIHEGRDELIGWLAAEAACGRAEPADLTYCRDRIAWPAEKLNPPPLLTGDDLVDAGFRPSKIFAELLETTRDAQLEGQITTRAEAIQYVKNLSPPSE